MFFGSSCPGSGRWGVFRVGSRSDPTPSFLGHCLAFRHHRMFRASRVCPQGQPRRCLLLWGPSPVLPLESVTRSRDLVTAARRRCSPASSSVTRAPWPLASVSESAAFRARDAGRQSVSYTEARSRLPPPGRQNSVLLTTPPSRPLFPLSPVTDHESKQRVCGAGVV